MDNKLNMEGYYDRKKEEAYKACFWSAIGIAVCLMALSFISCKTPQTVVLDNVHSENVKRTDTVVVTDTVVHERETVIREANSGDSALLTRYGIIRKDNERLLLLLQRERENEKSKEYEHVTDTLVRVDSIQVPYPIERKLNKWESFCLDYGKVMAGTSIAFVFIIAYWFLRFIRRKVI